MTLLLGLSTPGWAALAALGGALVGELVTAPRRTYSRVSGSASSASSETRTGSKKTRRPPPPSARPAYSIRVARRGDRGQLQGGLLAANGDRAGAAARGPEASGDLRDEGRVGHGRRRRGGARDADPGTGARLLRAVASEPDRGWRSSAWRRSTATRSFRRSRHAAALERLWTVSQASFGDPFGTDRPGASPLRAEALFLPI